MEFTGIEAVEQIVLPECNLLWPTVKFSPVKFHCNSTYLSGIMQNYSVSLKQVQHYRYIVESLSI